MSDRTSSAHEENADETKWDAFLKSHNESKQELKISAIREFAELKCRQKLARQRHIFGSVIAVLTGFLLWICLNESAHVELQELMGFFYATIRS